MSRYAEGTHVSVERSRVEIEKTLQRFGADQFVFASSDVPAAVFMGFRAQGRLIRFHLPLPRVEEFSKTEKGSSRTPLQREEAWKAEHRRRWRALMLVLKAKLEAVQSGITTFEQEFYAHILLPGGMTVYEMSHKGVEKAIESGKPPSFGGLLGYEGKENAK